MTVWSTFSDTDTELIYRHCTFLICFHILRNSVLSAENLTQCFFLWMERKKEENEKQAAVMLFSLAFMKSVVFSGTVQSASCNTQCPCHTDLCSIIIY